MDTSNANLKSEKGTILITGGTGLIGSYLSDQFYADGYHVTHLSRRSVNGKFKTYQWNIDQKYIDKEAIESADYIIHLAGAGVADKKWTNERKKLLYDSRIDSTRLLFEQVKEHNPNLRQFICASAIGYYGIDTDDQWLNEDADPGEGFLADIVKDWEKEADAFKALGIPTSKVRIGIVLTTEGGALEKIMQPIKYGVGAPLGTGKQYMSWIHIEDLARIFKFVIDHSLEGAVNGVGPNPVTNKAFTKTLASVLKKPIFLPNVPSFVMKLMLGEMSSIVLGGNRVSAEKIEDKGFKFTYPTLDKALRNLIT
jgi:hypothetical protein